MSSNNYAQPFDCDINEYLRNGDWTCEYFLLLGDASYLPDLDDMEYRGIRIAGQTAKALIRTSGENVKGMDWGNGHKGVEILADDCPACIVPASPYPRGLNMTELREWLRLRKENQ